MRAIKTIAILIVVGIVSAAVFGHPVGVIASLAVAAFFTKKDGFSGLVQNKIGSRPALKGHDAKHSPAFEDMHMGNYGAWSDTDL